MSSVSYYVILAEETDRKTWIGLIDDISISISIGDIDAVSRDFVVVKRGFVNVHYYYIPINVTFAATQISKQKTN